MDNDLHLGQYLRLLRKKCGYTQHEVSELLGVDRSTYAYYETDHTSPSLVTLQRLAQIFHVNVAYLLTAEKFQTHFSDPDARVFSNPNRNQSHIYDLEPDERLLLGRYRLADQETRDQIMKLLETSLHHDRHQPK